MTAKTIREMSSVIKSINRLMFDWQISWDREYIEQASVRCYVDDIHATARCVGDVCFEIEMILIGENNDDNQNR